MSRFDWITPMRKNTDEDRAARAVDKLYGQAAMKILDDGRVQLVAMPDAGCFNVAVTISREEALAQARIIIERLTPKE